VAHQQHEAGKNRLQESFQEVGFGSPEVPMAFMTLALGLALFGLFFGLVAACDRL